MELLSECPHCSGELRIYQRARRPYVVFFCRCGFSIRLDRKTGSPWVESATRQGPLTIPVPGPLLAKLPNTRRLV
jgi:hypothetical protein